MFATSSTIRHPLDWSYVEDSLFRQRKFWQVSGKIIIILTLRTSNGSIDFNYCKFFAWRIRCWSVRNFRHSNKFPNIRRTDVFWEDPKHLGAENSAISLLLAWQPCPLLFVRSNVRCVVLGEMKLQSFFFAVCTGSPGSGRRFWAKSAKWPLKWKLTGQFWV